MLRQKYSKLTTQQQKDGFWDDMFTSLKQREDMTDDEAWKEIQE